MHDNKSRRRPVGVWVLFSYATFFMVLLLFFALTVDTRLFDVFAAAGAAVYVIRFCGALLLVQRKAAAITPMRADAVLSSVLGLVQLVLVGLNLSSNPVVDAVEIAAPLVTAFVVAVAWSALWYAKRLERNGYFIPRLAEGRSEAPAV